MCIARGFLFCFSGKTSPTSILCRVETGTSTPPIPSTEDKAVSTESVAVDSKMAECISKLRTVRQRLEQQPGSTGGSTMHPAPGPIYTKTQHQPVCTVTQSPDKPVDVKVTSKVTGPPERSLKVRLGHKDSRPKLIMGRDSSTDSGPDSPTNSISRNRKARKQRPDLSQMLRSAAMAANSDSPPLPASAIPRQPLKRATKGSPSGQPPLIPKMDMNIKDYRKHSPGVKRRSKTKLALQTSSLATVSSGFNETISEQCDSPEVYKAEVKTLKRLLEDPLSGSDSNTDRPDIKVAISKKVDVNFLPSEENIRRTEKPLVRKLPRQDSRFQEKEPWRGLDREPTKTHVDWHKRRILTRQLSLDDLSRRASLSSGGGGSPGGSSTGLAGAGVGGSGQALQGLVPSLPGEYPQRPMMSFNYHRSTGQLQVKVPEEGATGSPTTTSATPSQLPVRKINRRASIDVAGIGRGTATSGPSDSGSPSTPPASCPMEGPFPPALVHGANRTIPRRRSMIAAPEFSTLKEDTPLADISTVPEEDNQSAAADQTSASKDEQSDSLQDKAETEKPKPPPRRKAQFRRGSIS